MTIKENLVKAIEILKQNKIEDSTLKARLLLAFVLNESKEYLIINSERRIDSALEEKYNNLLKKLINNVPLQYITNSQEFMGLKFYIDENVLIPRQDTETLVQEVLKIVGANIVRPKKHCTILDMCTGSGAIAISLAKNVFDAKITAVDISVEALKVAKENAKINHVKDKIEFMESDMFSKVSEKYDILVSNPPYVDEEHMKLLSKEVKKEPQIALDGGEDGLKFYKIIAAEGKKYLNNNGWVLLEIGYNQKEQVCEILSNQGYKDIVCVKDLASNDRVIICRKC
ncbi:MAG: peptide chain release factor N(5)-glutamine methyltransferase [Oscillospiraceae bacterium]|nr:peptide chain release factor N(5)-glutamine methyltransferase [Oscillospiraceae bacterium]